MAVRVGPVDVVAVEDEGGSRLDRALDDEPDEVLQDHGWKRTDYSVLKLSVYMLDGCDAEILVKEETLVSLKLFDSTTHAVISEGTAPLSECMMIGGSLIVGAGVEV